MSEGRISTISSGWPAGVRRRTGPPRRPESAAPIARYSQDHQAAPLGDHRQHGGADRGGGDRRRPLGLPVRTWFGQDDQLRQLDTELSAPQAVNVDLEEPGPAAADAGGHRRSRPDAPCPPGRRASPDGPRGYPSCRPTSPTASADGPGGRADDRAAGPGSRERAKRAQRHHHRPSSPLLAAKPTVAPWAPPASKSGSASAHVDGARVSPASDAAWPTSSAAWSPRGRWSWAASPSPASSASAATAKVPATTCRGLRPGLRGHDPRGRRPAAPTRGARRAGRGVRDARRRGRSPPGCRPTSPRCWTRMPRSASPTSGPRRVKEDGQACRSATRCAARDR